MNPNDKEVLEKVRAGWWAKSRTGPLIVDVCLWQQVVGECNDGRLVLFQMYFQNGQPKPAVEYCNKDDILALHAPTDDPQMATAYKLGEPEEVTREEARKKVSVGWEWRDGPEPMWYPLHPTDFDDPDISIRHIGSPGGNVYKIKE